MESFQFTNYYLPYFIILRGDVILEDYRKKPFKIKEWRASIGYPTLEKTQQALQNTTHYIQTLEGETCEYIQAYHNTGVHTL